MFRYLQIPPIYQHKVLFWGILGALVMRVIFIFAGVALIEKFHWTVYLFGIFLIYTGYKMFSEKDKKLEPEKNIFIRLVKRFIPISQEIQSDKFFVRQNGRVHATRLFLVLLFIEATDLIFAVDSIPAILAITQDEFMVYTSNVFAILGLRSLYFALAHLIDRFVYLTYGLALILVFVGVKMVFIDVFKIPVFISLLVIAFVISASVILSFLKTKRDTTNKGQADLL